ncbi:MAG: tetratricopeptide repeat protein [Bryobacteraceae bacterium]
MKSKKQRPAPKPAAPHAPAPSPAPPLKAWHAALGLAAALGTAMLVYAPALNGPFVFDDIYLPFFSPRLAAAPLPVAIHGTRPLLLFSFWINSKLAGAEPFLYHWFNVLFHVLNAFLIFLIARKLFAWSGCEGRSREWLAAFAGAVFLLHPVQTEAVSYVTSRSENLSVLFLLSAVAIFIYRKRTAISWPVVLAILILYAAAASTKEHTAVLPAVLLLVDYFWNPGFSFSGIRRNWRLYVPIAVGAALALAYVFDILRQAVTAGFGMKELPWNHYFYTQWRVLWIYIRLFLFPAGQNADWAHATVRSPFDPMALAGLIGLLGVVGAAIWYRKRYPLASFAILCALLLFAPTSSVVPIEDVVAERRMYLPMLGLSLAAAELLRHWRARPRMRAGVAAVALVILGAACHQRNQVWGSDRLLWEDVLKKSPWNARAREHLGVAYYKEGRCQDAAAQFEALAKEQRPEARAFVNWALALDCLGQPEQAKEKLQQAIAVAPASDVYAQLAMLYGKLGNSEEAYRAIEKALELDPRNDMAYFYRGNLRSLEGDYARAADDYRQALAVNPDNEPARRGLARVLGRSKGP